MSEEQVDLVLSAINHPIRRGIVRYLAEAGPQSYTSLMERFRLQTGTLNHHLRMLEPLLEQNGDKRYLLNRDGEIAYQTLMHIEAMLSRPRLPALRRRRITPVIRGLPLVFYKLLIHPSQAFVEAQDRLGSYLLCGLMILALYMTSTPISVFPAVFRSLAGVIGMLIFSYIFPRAVYNKSPRFPRLLASIGMSYLPLLVFNLLIMFSFFEFIASISSPLMLEDPGYAALIQVYAALFIWRFALLFLAFRDSCRLSSGQSVVAVFAFSVAESALALILEHLFRLY
ncbi:MAG: helix-turn-helix domain-containing protein [Candidatus Bathyarchaeia archaeon]